MTAPRDDAAPPFYLAGLDLRGRRVLVAGAGRVARRRLPALLAAGASVEVVAPRALPDIEEWAADGVLTLVTRPVESSDVGGAWYVLAATDDAAVNATVAAAALAQGTFCVRADDASGGTARTPATASVGGLGVGVLGERDPRRSMRARDAAAAALRGLGDPVLAPGEVTLVGGGPGDPDLLTLAGLKALLDADVVLVDHLAPDVSHLVPARVEVVNVGKTPFGPATPQERINALLVEHARAGRRVVRLKGGDPFVFGRGGEEWLACAEAGVTVRVVPGVTSAVAAPGVAGIPVTHRTLSQGFTVVSGHLAPGDPRSTLDWPLLARTNTTLVVLMGVTHLAAIAEALASGGLPPDTPAAVVARAFHPDARVLRGTLGTIAAQALEGGVRPPAITVIGDVAALELAP